MHGPDDAVRSVAAGLLVASGVAALALAGGLVGLVYSVRLEAALERIAEAATRAETRPNDQLPKYDAEEVAARLDAVINRLRAALGTTD